MNQLTMELRSVDPEGRTVIGVVAPYDEVTYLTGERDGEKIRRGAFKRSLGQKKQRIPLCRNHVHDVALGWSTRFVEGDVLEGTFGVNDGGPGDDLLDELRQGYLTGMSVGFRPIRSVRGDAGVREIVEAELIEVSMVGIPAYAGATLLSVRSAALIPARPAVNLDPIPLVWHTSRQPNSRPAGPEPRRPATS
jgi:Escherichia/Staphylococcus phage prohead protease